MRMGEIDKNTGWFSVYFTPTDFSHYPIALIMGDFVQNLRSALDYIVTALVNKSPGAVLSNNHQFPIQTIEGNYRGQVGTETIAKPDGPLGGVIFGLREIWDLQPFHRKPDPSEDPLFHINWLSNADKHRHIIGFEPYLRGPSRIWVRSGVVLEEIALHVPEAAYKEFEVARFRLAFPLPAEIKIDYDISMGIQYVAKPFGTYSPRFDLNAGIMNSLYDHVAMVVNLFKKL